MKPFTHCRDNSGIFDIIAPASTMPPPATMVVLLAHMRSGSTLLGDILQQHAGVFYVFEPLRGADLYRAQKRKIEFLGESTLSEFYG